MNMTNKSKVVVSGVRVIYLSEIKPTETAGCYRTLRVYGRGQILEVRLFADELSALDFKPAEERPAAKQREPEEPEEINF